MIWIHSGRGVLLRNIKRCFQLTGQKERLCKLIATNHEASRREIETEPLRRTSNELIDHLSIYLSSDSNTRYDTILGKTLRTTEATLTWSRCAYSAQLYHNINPIKYVTERPNNLSTSSNFVAGVKSNSFYRNVEEVSLTNAFNKNYTSWWNDGFESYLRIWVCLSSLHNFVTFVDIFICFCPTMKVSVECAIRD